AIVLSGDQELRREFRDHLPADAVIADLEWNPAMGPRELALAVQAAAEAARGHVQARAIARALEGSAPVQDWQTAAAAAREGRLHEVWLNPAAALHVYLCNQCGTVAEGPEPCTNCSAPPYDRLPAPELLVRGANETGAQIHFASGEAVELLDKGTGLVGRWRY
ncbi:MAG: hypothetical protein ABI782_11730, partial [Anaerolineaceae bacterium]